MKDENGAATRCLCLTTRINGRAMMLLAESVDFISKDRVCSERRR